MHSKRIVTAVSTLCFSVCVGGSAIADMGDCGQPATNGANPTATDALAILVGAVGLGPCDLAVCDVNCSLDITATDALTVLQFAVGQPVMLQCAPCNTTTTTTLGGGFPTLTAGDFPAVTPCADRDTLATDARFAGALAGAAELMFTVNFTQFDTNGFPEICGLSDVDNALAPMDIPWDPAEMNEVKLCYDLSLFSDLTQLFFEITPGGMDLCQTGTAFGGEGFPRAGVYRKDYCLEFGADHYAVRVRKTISGAQADADVIGLGISPTDVRVCDGTTLISTDTQARAFIANNPGGFSVTLRDSDCTSGAELITVQFEIICIKSQLTDCTWDFAEGCAP